MTISDTALFVTGTGWRSRGNGSAAGGDVIFVSNPNSTSRCLNRSSAA
ncbi:MAG: hypothetical protein HYR84_08300 [Planctomycetes bacterium]|nr:hypothetical protein [Planctomycetota bacterium]